MFLMDTKTKPTLLVATAMFVLRLSLQVSVSLGADTISANQSLSGDEVIVSAGGVFELGFFTPGNSLNYYIGIWYKQISTRTVVWVANREKPVSDKFSSVLRISDDNLVLFNESQIPIWSTNAKPTTSGTTQAVLLDNGNLVLDDGSNPSTPLWQSFDHPCNTFLPGGRIGYTGINKSNKIALTSWKNSEDPAPGDYSLEQFLVGSEVYFVMWNRSSSEISWSTGNWNGKTFSSVPEMRLDYIFNYSYISNANESYFTYDVYNSSIISRFMIDGLGQLKQLTWLQSDGWVMFWSQPRNPCQVYALCGAYGSCIEDSWLPCRCLTGFEPKSPSDWYLTEYSGGCRRKAELQCPNRDRFIKSPGMSLSGAQKTVLVSKTAECEAACLNDCSCTAYAYESNSCLIWNGDLMNLQQLALNESRGRTLYVRVAASSFPSPKSKKGINIVIVLGSASGFAGCLSLFVFLALRRRRKKMVRAGKSMEGSLVVFEYRFLQNATNNFSEKLGGGGFGSVFKGTLPESTVIAVKQLDSISQGEKQFRAEVSTIGTIQHVNLVRLHGFCSRGTKKLLVYDYMPNGSLDSHIFRTNNSKVLNWETRYQIALGTARGLCYLHDECRECIIHCDIKPDNVLLDAEFCPKVADFGLAKLVGRDFSRVLTTIRGTRGYLAPEWISGVAITAKADVYSFGMMLFEIISGRRNSTYYVEGEVSFFPIWAASIIIEGGDVFSLLDPRLEGNADPERLIRVCRLACWCIQYEETQRPSMGQIVQILEELINVNLPPLPRLFQAFLDKPDEIIAPTEWSSSPESSQAGNGMSTTSSRVKSNESSSLLMS